jgi:hypothetical protein
MIKLKRLQRGIVPFGSGWGTPAFAIEIESDDAVVEADEGKTPFQVNADKLLMDITETVKVNQWAELWTLELAGKGRGVSCYFVGDEWISKENRGVTGEFFRLFSRISVETQRMLAIQKLAEPYMAWVGTPTHYTGMDDFYQQFNHCVVDCPLSADYNQMAFMEQKNHPFTRFYFNMETVDDVNKVDKFYSEPGLLEGLSPVKVQITASQEAWSQAIDLSMKTGFRVCPKRTVTEGFLEVRSW